MNLVENAPAADSVDIDVKRVSKELKPWTNFTSWSK
jgi:hypothetical protein